MLLGLLLASTFSSVFKKKEISGCSDSLKPEDVWEQTVKTYAPQAVITKTMNQVLSTITLNGKTDKGRIRFPAKADIGTIWILTAVQQTSSEPAHQEHTNMIFTLIGELESFDLVNSQKELRIAEGLVD